MIQKLRNVRRFINQVVIAPHIDVARPHNGFGTKGVVHFKPGKVVGRSLIQTPKLFGKVEGQSVPSAPGAGFSQQLIKELIIPLDNITVDIPYYIAGTVLWYISSTNTTDALAVRIASINADSLPWQPGNGVEGVPYSVVYISVPVAVAGAKAKLVYFADTPQAPVRFF